LTTIFAFGLVGEQMSSTAALGGFVILVGVVLQAIAGAKSDQTVSPSGNVLKARDATSGVGRVKVSEVRAPHTRPAHQAQLGKRAQSLVYLLARFPQGADLPTIQRLTGASRPTLHHELMRLRKLGYIVLADRCYVLYPSLIPICVPSYDFHISLVVAADLASASGKSPL
jgi:hypothetical protein